MEGVLIDEAPGGGQDLDVGRKVGWGSFEVVIHVVVGTRFGPFVEGNANRSGLVIGVHKDFNHCDPIFGSADVAVGAGHGGIHIRGQRMVLPD